MEELKLDISELETLLDSCKRPKVKDALSITLRKFQTELIALKEKQEKETAKTTTTTVKPAVSNGTNQPYDFVVKNYSWDQSDKFVKIYLTGLDGLKDAMTEEQVVKELESASAKVTIPNFKGKNHIFQVLKLAEEIVPEKSYVKVKSDMLVIFLLKGEPKKWTHLKAVEAEAAKKEQDRQKSKMEENSSDPQAGIMNLMKDMYQNGDDDMKRTIAKAWSESQDKKAGAGGLGGMGGLGAMGDLGL